MKPSVHEGAPVEAASLSRADLGARGIDAEPIVPRLYLGSVPPQGSTLRDAGFHVVALCAAEYQDRQHDGVAVVRCPLADRDPEGRGAPSWVVFTADERGRVRAAALRLAELHRRGAWLLVTCAAGRNRSGVVTATVLHELTGWPGAECVARVRAARTAAPALTNASFVEFLRSL